MKKTKISNISQLFYVKQNELCNGLIVRVEKQDGKNVVIYKEETPVIHLYDKHYYAFNKNKTYESLPLEYIIESINPNKSEDRLSYYNEGEYICSSTPIVEKENNNFYRFNDLLPEPLKNTFRFNEANSELIYNLYVRNCDIFLGSVTTVSKRKMALMKHDGYRILLAYKNHEYFDPLEQKIYEEFDITKIFKISNDNTFKPLKKQLVEVVPLCDRIMDKYEMTKMSYVLKKALDVMKNCEESEAEYVRRRKEY